jgi:mannose-6-phosphate isomerase-like protein (cupin superfamily)
MVYKYNEKNKTIINDNFNFNKVYMDSEKLDYTVINLNGEHGLCSNNRSTKYWIILEGEAKVVLDEKPYDVQKDDFVVIEKNVKHNIIGNVKFGLICIPPFNKDDEKCY